MQVKYYALIVINVILYADTAVTNANRRKSIKQYAVSVPRNLNIFQTLDDMKEIHLTQTFIAGFPHLKSILLLAVDDDFLNEKLIEMAAKLPVLSKMDIRIWNKLDRFDYNEYDIDVKWRERMSFIN